MNKFKPGQEVWLYFFTPTPKNGGPATAEIRKRVFLRESKPSWANNELRYVAARSTKGREDLGISYRPERVFATRADALAALRTAIDDKVAEITALKHSFTESL